MVFVKRDCPETAYVLTAVGKTATTGICNLEAAYGALVAGNFDDLDDIAVVPVAAHGELHALAEDGALLEHAAAHGRRLSGNDDLGNIQYVFKQRVVPRVARDLAQHLVLEVLHLGIEFSHAVLTP